MTDTCPVCHRTAAYDHIGCATELEHIVESRLKDFATVVRQRNEAMAERDRYRDLAAKYKAELDAESAKRCETCSHKVSKQDYAFYWCRDRGLRVWLDQSCPDWEARP